MRTLVLIRHAKSSWDTVGLADHDRPLNDRGRRDAPRMGRRLARRGTVPDLIVTSSAVRARSTAELIASELGAGTVVEAARIAVDERLYASSVEELALVIRSLDDDLGCVALVGHNPEISELARRFSNEIDEMPTTAVVELSFDLASWADFGVTAPTMVLFDSPRRSQ
ncbi:SixA phosphatase family protein [Luethyella okanaganae]|uniref:SixA phosphatase family protein n=1 Tax=Luethyella okanaganae TaxID=69372 RepID=A0ABW1VH26_9MICO